MIRPILTCDRPGCMALYKPDTDAGADVLERAARAVGWRRLTAASHACPACTRGTGPVLELGECATCTGRTGFKADGEVCLYCGQLTPSDPENERTN